MVLLFIDDIVMAINDLAHFHNWATEFEDTKPSWIGSTFMDEED